MPPPVLSPLIHVREDCLGQRVGGRGRQAGWGRGGGGAPRQLEEVTDKTAAAAAAHCGPACAQPLREVDRSSVARTQGARTLARFVYLRASLSVCVQKALSVQVKQFSERISRRERERKTISTYSRDGPEDTSPGVSTEFLSSKAAAAGKKRALRSYLNPFL